MAKSKTHRLPGGDNPAIPWRLMSESKQAEPLARPGLGNDQVMSHGEIRAIEVLLVEDSPGDAELTVEGMELAKVCNHLHRVRDGVQAMEFLHRQGPYAHAPRPDLILLDLRLPRKDGRQVLAEIKADENLKIIPVAVLADSHAERQRLRSYQLLTGFYLTKPVDFTQFQELVRSIESFWFMVVRVQNRRADVSPQY
jgi:CheY-like chemotaxis protein